MTTRPPNRQPGRERTALFRSLTFREHDTGGHPENAGRLAAIETALERLDLLGGRPNIPFTAAPDDVLARVHDPRYIAGIREFAAQGGGWLDADTAVGARSVDVATLAVGAGIAAVDAILDGRAQRGFILARPRDTMPLRPAAWDSACSIRWRSPPRTRSITAWTGC